MELFIAFLVVSFSAGLFIFDRRPDRRAYFLLAAALLLCIAYYFLRMF